MRIPILLIAATAFGQDADIKNPHTTPADIAAGAKIFRSHCAECHGLNGEGGRGPDLRTGVFFHGSTDADLFGNITDGIAGTAMPGVFFSRDQVWQAVAYVRSLSQTGASPPQGDPSHGAKLFREKGCIGCHLLRGEGAFKGPDLSVIGSQRSAAHLRQAILEPDAKVLRDFWVAKITLENGQNYAGFLLNEGAYSVQLLDFQKGLTSLPTRDFRKFEIEKSSIMPSFKGKLTDNEVTDIVAYLWSLKRRSE
jgi:putative heme-binding domain-containing protein